MSEYTYLDHAFNLDIESKVDVHPHEHKLARNYAFGIYLGYDFVDLCQMDAESCYESGEPKPYTEGYDGWLSCRKEIESIIGEVPLKNLYELYQVKPTLTGFKEPLDRLYELEVDVYTALQKVTHPEDFEDADTASLPDDF